MRKDLIKIKPIYSSFLSCDKDLEKILKVLFVDSKPYSDILKRLLIINEPDCLDMNNQEYQKLIDSKSLGDLINEGYIRLNPKISRESFPDIQSYIIIKFDTFSNSRNPQFRENTIDFQVVCYVDAWVLEDYKVRPLAICGYIDGILNSLTNETKQLLTGSNNNIRLSGMSTYEFLLCKFYELNEDLSMYFLSYEAMHFTEDKEQIGEV